MPESNFVFVDIGNSAIKFATCESIDSATWSQSGSHFHEQLIDENTFSFLHEAASRNRQWFVCSVNSEACGQLLELLNNHRPDDLVTELDCDCYPFEISPDPASSIGVDRLMAAAGAVACYPKKNLVVVDAGTAVTIDAVDQDSRFLGGTIRAGLHLQRAALHSYTSALPDLSRDERNLSEHIFGQDTAEAILAGTGFGELGAIMSIVQVMEDQFESEVQVVITGGGARWMKPYMPEEWTFTDDLVLKGVQEVARHLDRVE